MLKIFFLLACFTPSGFSLPTQPFVGLAKKVQPSVVNISTSAITKTFLRLGPDLYVPQPYGRKKQAAGSGFIIDSKGFIVTNAHVVKNADQINVQLAQDNRLYSARLVGKDDLSDVALIKIQASKPLTPIKLGSSSQVQVGEFVAAFGNPHGYGHTVTQGIISAVKRELDDLNLFPLLQTDASINPGNSGGPLVNLKGEVLGINNATSAQAEGISFAIPIDNVKNILSDLKKHGYVRRGYIGVLLSYAVNARGAFVMDVSKKGPAYQAGVRSRDRIIKFGKISIKDPSDLIKAIAKTPIGTKVKLVLIRKNRKKHVSIRIQAITSKRF